MGAMPLTMLLAQHLTSRPGYSITPKARPTHPVQPGSVQVLGLARRPQWLQVLGQQHEVLPHAGHAGLGVGAEGWQPQRPRLAALRPHALPGQPSHLAVHLQGTQVSLASPVSHVSQGLESGLSRPCPGRLLVAVLYAGVVQVRSTGFPCSGARWCHPPSGLPLLQRASRASEGGFAP